jgi:hypothetical protein
MVDFLRKRPWTRTTHSLSALETVVEEEGVADSPALSKAGHASAKTMYGRTPAIRWNLV